MVSDLELAHAQVVELKRLLVATQEASDNIGAGFRESQRQNAELCAALSKLADKWGRLAGVHLGPDAEAMRRCRTELLAVLGEPG